MIDVKAQGKNKYRVKMDKPDGHVMQTIADHFSISIEAAVTSVIYRGIDSIKTQMNIDKEDKQVRDEQGYNG